MTTQRHQLPCPRCGGRGHFLSPPNYRPIKPGEQNADGTWRCDFCDGAGTVGDAGEWIGVCRDCDAEMGEAEARTHDGEVVALEAAETAPSVDAPGSDPAGKYDDTGRVRAGFSADPSQGECEVCGATPGQTHEDEDCFK